MRRVAEGKATAQAEAGEWKRKYELERKRNLQLEQEGTQLPIIVVKIFILFVAEYCLYHSWSFS